MKHSEYFYIPSKNIKNDIVEFKGAELKHLAVVLRKKYHDVVSVVDGKGNVFTVVLTQIGRNSAVGTIQKRSRYLGEPNFKLTLAQAISKGNRFDWVVEKGTEIGVSKFIPLITERSIAKGSETKRNRWQKVAIAAMKQCARSVLPEITSPQTIDQIFYAKEIYDFNLIAHSEAHAKSLAEIIIQGKRKLAHISKIKSGIILVGPEGGFSPDEIKKAKSQNFQTFSLGLRRLRTETAGIMASAIIMELMDNWVS